MQAFPSTESYSCRSNWPLQSTDLQNFGEFHGHRGSRGGEGQVHTSCAFQPHCSSHQPSTVMISWNEGVTQMCLPEKALVTQTGRGHPCPIWLTLLISFRRQTKQQTVEQCKEKTERISPRLQEATFNRSPSAIKNRNKARIKRGINAHIIIIIPSLHHVSVRMRQFKQIMSVLPLHLDALIPYNPPLSLSKASPHASTPHRRASPAFKRTRRALLKQNTPSVQLLAPAVIKILE